MRGLRMVQISAGLALLLVLFGSTFSQVKAGDGPFITIHNRLCPAGYAGNDIYGDCHDTPQAAGVEFTISGPVNASAATDGSGKVTFADLLTGTYTIIGGAADSGTSTVIYCSFENEPETLTAFDPALGVIVNFPAEAPSNGYICDWYHIPAEGTIPDGEEPTDNGWYTLTIHNRICPVGYTGSSFYEDCHDNPQTSNLEFNVIRDGDIGVAGGPTDDAGNVTFTELPPAAYVIHGGVPGEFADAVVYCSIEGIDDTLVALPETEFGGFILTTNPNPLGWHYICDWYNIPFDQSGGEDPGDGGAGEEDGYTLTIHNRICPVGYAGKDIYGECHDNAPTTPVEFNVGQGDMVFAGGTTDAAGNLTLEIPRAGGFTVFDGVSAEFADTVVYCSNDQEPDSLESAMETEFGFLVDFPADATSWNVTCDWYHIPYDMDGGDDGTATPTPTPSAGGDDDEEVVTVLPNSGSGSEAESSTNIALYGLGILALGVTAFTMRRRAPR